jgi:hypothetical protein
VNKTRLTLRDTAWFFLPLVLNVQFMSVSHSIINAGLARLDDAITALAAFSVAMVLHLFIASPSYQNHTITITMVRGRRSFNGTLIFVLLMASYVSIMLTLVAYTPVGEFILYRLLGVNHEVGEGARSVLRLLVFLPFATGLRGLFQGMVIRARRTGLVSFATGIRIITLLGYLWLGLRWFSGPQVAAFALLCCVITETLLVGLFAWRVRLPATGEDEKSFPQILRYALPLAYSSGLQQAVPLLINAIISRLPDGTLALAAFGVVRGFLFLLAGPMRNLQQAYLTLIRAPEDYTVLVRFFNQVSLGMALIMLAVAWPLNQLVLGSVMGLDSAMCSYITWPLTLCAFFPWLYGAANLLRGWFAGAHLTGRLGWSTIYKVMLVIICWPLLLILPWSPPGIAVAIFLLLATEACEAFYLRGQRAPLLPEHGLVPLGASPVK